jgi:hypothetical protein
MITSLKQHTLLHLMTVLSPAEFKLAAYLYLTITDTNEPIVRTIDELAQATHLGRRTISECRVKLLSQGVIWLASTGREKSRYALPEEYLAEVAGTAQHEQSHEVGDAENEPPAVDCPIAMQQKINEEFKILLAGLCGGFVDDRFVAHVQRYFLVDTYLNDVLRRMQGRKFYVYSHAKHNLGRQRPHPYAAHVIGAIGYECCMHGVGPLCLNPNPPATHGVEPWDANAS